jgi:hypothetical protein
MTLSANSDGVVHGRFTIPANVKAGVKLVHFGGQGGSYADADFYGQGFLETRIMQEQTTVVKTRKKHDCLLLIDPLAQTFTLTGSSTYCLTGVQLYVTAKHATDPIYVHIRETQTGFPTRVIVAEAIKIADDIVEDAWNMFAFDTPFIASPGVEYAIVALCNNSTSAIGIATLGEFDSTAQKFATSQPYQVGVLLSSSNASTWTAHQNSDMAFKIMAANYTSPSLITDLGTVSIVDATDLLVLATTDQPASSAIATFQLTLPDGATTVVNSGQSIRLTDDQKTGDVGIKSVLTSNANQSALLAPGTQVVAGELQATADYVTPAIVANSGGDIIVVYDAIVPAGASVSVYICDDDDLVWGSAIPVDSGYPVAAANGSSEFKHTLESFTAAKIRAKLVLSGTRDARPFVYNLRVSTV